VLTFWELSGRMRFEIVLDIFERAHRAAVELARPARERVVMAGWMVGLSVVADDAYFTRFAGEWRAQLEHDSGLELYRGLSEIDDPGARLMRTLTLVSERFAATPAAERGYAPDEAIRLLVICVGASIAIGSRSYDCKLLSSLPGLLEPFVALSPIITAVRLNVQASCALSGDARMEQARALWLDVYQRLAAIDATQLPAIDTFRNAVAYALGLVEARIGLESAKDWAELLDRDPAQKINALYLRKVICLHHGDFEGAERWRKRAEIVALQAPMRQMFTNVVLAELWAHAAAGDLVGVKEALDRIVPLSAIYPGWLPVRALAQAQFERLRGDLEAAVVAFEGCLELCAPDPREPERGVMVWPSCMGGYLQTLQLLGRCEQARTLGEQALALCRERDIGISSHEIARPLALAEAKHGNFARAWELLERVVAEQSELGVRGLQLGLSYEACTRVAIWAGDADRLHRYAQLTATEYRYGRGSPLGARYERLMEEARAAGLAAMPELAEFVSTLLPITRTQARDATSTSVLEAMSGAGDRSERAERALRLLCAGRNASSGQLFLCTASGLAFAASEGPGEPPEGLRKFLEAYLRADDAACDSATSLVTDVGAEAAQPATCWTDANGAVHRPLVLNGVLDGASRQIGVASFVDSPEPRRVEVALCTAIAAYLIEAGDV
jgi:hypothetical protein